jgi:hypothetical protein
MKRLAAFAFYAVGAIAIVYLALYAYSAFTGRRPQPGDPIHIFRRPDAPNYSWVLPNHLKQSSYETGAGLLRLARKDGGHPPAEAVARA